MATGSARTVIARPPAEVWAAVADITRMGEWSPECVAGRWVGGATGPAGRTVKAWTTTSVVTACEPGSVFQFVAEGYTTWTYRFEPSGVDGSATAVIETFEYEPKGVMGFVYERVLFRSKAMTRGMQRTLDRVKAALEA